MTPPTPDGLDGEGRRGVIDANVYERFVPFDVEDAVWNGPPGRIAWEIVGEREWGLSAGVPLSSVVVELPDPFLLLGLNGNCRVSRLLEVLNCSIDEDELGVSVVVMTAFECLLRGLKAVAKLPQTAPHRRRTHLVALCLERMGKLLCALRRPSKRRLWSAACHRVDQSFEGVQQGGLLLRSRLPTRTRASDAGRVKVVMFEVSQASLDRVPTHASYPRDRRYTSIPEGTCFSARSEASTALIESRRQRLELLPYDCLHGPVSLHASGSHDGRQRQADRRKK